MRLSRTLSLYVLRELCTYTALGFAAFVSILIVQNVLRRLEDLMAVGVTASDAAAVLGCLFVMLAAYAVPIAFLFGVLVAMGRLSADSEVVAMRACGIGLRGLLVPVLAVAVVVSIVSAGLIVQIEPQARDRLRTVLKEVASRGALIEPGKFRALDKTRVFYVQDRDRENRLQKVFVDDRSNPERPFRVFAESGRFALQPERAVIQLELENGEIHFDSASDGEDRYRRISFEHFDYEVDASTILDAARLRWPKNLSVPQLLQALEWIGRGELPEDYPEREARPYRVQLHRRLALPLAPVLFGLVAVPLGLRRTRGARSWGAMLCIALVFSYYVLLSFGEFLGQEGYAPTALALWLPNLAFAVAAVPLLKRARRGGL